MGRDAQPADSSLADAAQLQALFGSNVVGMASGEGDLIQEANDEFLRIVGRTRDDLAGGVGWPQITPSEHVERDAGAMRDIRRDGGSLVQKDFCRPDGRRVPVLAAVAAVSWDPYRWVAVVIDLSREERLRQLVQSEGAIVSTLLEDAPIGFALIDPDMRFVRINHELAAMNGPSVSEHEGASVFDLLPGLRASAEPVLRRVLETGEPLRDVEIVGETPADPGVTHTWLESFFPVHVPQGPTVGVAAVASDVTELRRLQRQVADTMRRQREALQQLQSSLLPLLPEVAGVGLAARYLPAADEVRLGGDWFDVVHAPDGRLVLSVGDVVGHGLTAVGLMARASAAMRAYVSDGHSPDQVLARLNRLLHDPYSAGMASVVVVFADLATGRVEYASAGHPFALLADPEGHVDVLDSAQGPMLGGLPDARYATATTAVAPGASLLLYTDGLIERRGENLDDGLARLVGCLTEGPRTTGTAARLVQRAVDVCLADQERGDDVCVLALTRDRLGADPAVALP